MIQEAGGPRLLFEPAQPVIVGRERRGQNLDGDFSPQPRVARAVNLAHSTGAQRTDNLVRPQLCAWLDSHGWNARIIAEGCGHIWAGIDILTHSS
jgi:hypothetical protein